MPQPRRGSQQRAIEDFLARSCHIKKRWEVLGHSFDSRAVVLPQLLMFECNNCGAQVRVWHDHVQPPSIPTCSSLMESE